MNFIYRMIGNRETAEEVALEVFMKVYRNLDIFDPKKKFLPWLFTIARNLSKNALRDKKYFHEISLEMAVLGEDENLTLKDTIADSSLRPDLIAEDEELAAEAQRVLDTMPHDNKIVIL